MKSRSKRYLLTGGGTGGHVYPTLAIAERLKETWPDAEFLYIGKRDKIEAELVPRNGYRIEFVRSLPYPGGRSIRRLPGFLLNLALGILGASRHILKFRPDVAITVGGYVSAPVTISCVLLRKLRLTRCRLFLHEQNSIPGKMNQLSGRWADLIGVSFAGSARFFPENRVKIVGYPVRKEIGKTENNNIRKNMGIPSGDKVVFAFGASQGARTINRAVVLALPRLLADESITIIHATGRKKKGLSGYDPISDTDRHIALSGIPPERMNKYIRREYFHNIDEIYSITDLVITRGGAGSLAEIEKCHLPVIVVPKSDLADDHQALNALILQENGTAITLLEDIKPDLDNRLTEYVDPEKLAELTLSLCGNPGVLKQMGVPVDVESVKEPLENIFKSINYLLQCDSETDYELDSESGTCAESDNPDVIDTGRNAKTWLSWASMGPFSLLKSLEVRIDGEKTEDIYRPVELDYLYYRTRKLLRDEKWQIRNVGVKMAGVLRYKEALPELKKILVDKRKASFLARMLGGDLHQVGFIRRNAVSSIASIGIVEDEIIQILGELLKDPYYEVRTKACESIGALKAEDEHGSSTSRLESLLEREGVLEVKSAALAALGSITSNPESTDVFKRFLLSGDWILREAALHGLTSMVEREIISDPRLQTDRILLTCPQFHPVFPLHVALSRLYRRVGSRSRK